MNEPICFSGSPLDRNEPRRHDPTWIAERLAADETRLLPVWRLSVLVQAGAEPRLAWATTALRDALEEKIEPIFLGVRDAVAHFAVDLSTDPEPLETFEWRGLAAFSELRAVAGQLPAGEAAIAAQARHLVDWHSRHLFCPGCGGPTRSKDGGHARECEAPACGAEHFPRTDPVVIMLVLDGERCLLGRQPTWPRPFYSALAGFVEPGETLEEAVRREVLEEAGIRVGEVCYRASQPWPFPASLMLGCTARAESREIHVDGRELEAAAWFSREQVAAALTEPTRELAVPPPLAIAHHLIRRWAERKP